jgi:hypothetical protein
MSLKSQGSATEFVCGSQKVATAARFAVGQLAQFEGLESRTMMSAVDLSSENELVIQGTKFADDIRITQKHDVITVEDRKRSSRDPLRKQSFFADDVTKITFDGGAGNDVFYAKGVIVEMEASGGTGNDRLTAGDDNATLSGDDGRDTLVGGGADDSLSGGASNDNLDGRGGDDDITGDAGDDVMLGGDGDDTIHADDGARDHRIDGGDGTNSAAYDAADARYVRNIDKRITDEDESGDDDGSSSASALSVRTAAASTQKLVDVTQTRTGFNVTTNTGNVRFDFLERFNPAKAEDPNGRFVNVRVTRNGRQTLLNKDIAFAKLPEIFPEAAAKSGVQPRSFLGFIGGIFDKLRNSLQKAANKLIDKFGKQLGKFLKDGVDRVISYAGNFLKKIVDIILGKAPTPTTVLQHLTDAIDGLATRRATNPTEFVPAPQRLSSLVQPAVSGDPTGAAVNAMVNALKSL